MQNIGRKLILFIKLLLVAIIIITIYFLIHQTIQEKNQDNTFTELENLSIFDNVVTIENTEDEENSEKIYNKEEIQDIKNSQVIQNVDLQKLYNINTDIIGWIQIDNTNINYPVMQNGEFYLNKDFYKKSSSYGIPFLASYCNIQNSDNLIIFGHHMKNHKMFADLENYKSESYYNNHKTIKFYTLENGKTLLNTYEVIIAFKTVAYSEEGFQYHTFYKASNEKEYNDYISKCKELELYDTGKTAKYGEKLITLSTCEYSQMNGRMVIIAKKI